MVVRLQRITAARFLLTGKMADGNLGLDVDRNPQGFGVGFLVESRNIGIVASGSLIFSMTWSFAHAAETPLNQAMLNFYGDMGIK